MDESQRILEVYKRREAEKQHKPGFFGYENLAHMLRKYERYRTSLCLLKTFGFNLLSDLAILDVGCGDGTMLREFIQWGAQPECVAGIELRPEPVEIAKRLNPNLDVRCGSASELPWPDASFDLVCQHTVFTSILDPVMKRQIAAEMSRTLRPGGVVLWYDFMYNNPRNHDVRGIKANEIHSLFPSFTIRLRRITLAPFIARSLPEPLLPILYPLLSAVPILRAHYLGLLFKP